MRDELIISLILFIIISIISCVTAYKFYKAKNGVLRRLMIWFFIVEVYVYLVSALYFTLASYDIEPISMGLFRFIVLLPKAVMMLRILQYLKHNR